MRRVQLAGIIAIIAASCDDQTPVPEWEVATLTLAGRSRAHLDFLGASTDGRAFAFIVSHGDGFCGGSTAHLFDVAGAELDSAHIIHCDVIDDQVKEARKKWRLHLRRWIADYGLAAARERPAVSVTNATDLRPSRGAGAPGRAPNWPGPVFLLASGDRIQARSAPAGAPLLDVSAPGTDGIAVPVLIAGGTKIAWMVVRRTGDREVRSWAFVTPSR